MEPDSMIQPEAEARNWLELPAEVMSTILLKLGAIEILTIAQNVCSSWRKICKDPLMWRVIDTHNWEFLVGAKYDVEIICRQCVDRSCGQLVDINIEYFGTDTLLRYIAQSSNRLRRLRMVDCEDVSDEGLGKAVSKFPLLEHLEIFTSSFYEEALKRVGRCCPLLKLLKLNKEFWGGRGPQIRSDEEVLVIAETMPKLRHLQIFGNVLTDTGLQAILDGCPDLESLDLRQCLNLNFAGQLGKKCAERIKTLHLPHDPTDDYECGIENNLSDFEDYSSDDIRVLTDSDDDDNCGCSSGDSDFFDYEDYYYSSSGDSDDDDYDE